MIVSMMILMIVFDDSVDSLNQEQLATTRQRVII